MNSMIRHLILAALLAAAALTAGAQAITRVEPPSWFIGMENPELQLMVYGKEIGSYDVAVSYPGVTVSTLVRTDNPNYLFINLKIEPETKEGDVPFEFSKGKTRITYNYQLQQKPTMKMRGLDASDVIYLIMPDRFANGDPENDNVQGMVEKVNRNNPGGRHGGDLKGISDNLDYICRLGVTGIWLNPFLENNQPAYSYHGYSTTDFYKVDPRYGTNDEFRSLVEKAHANDLKVVMDMIFNHIGSHHWWMKDLPSRDWIHQFREFTRTNYRVSTQMDPYVAETDARLSEKGWFDRTMPDLNQSNPLVEKYLTQNSLWWIAWSGIDGIRMDTYPYPEKNMMARWAKRVTDEFPGFFIVGEVWFEQEALTAYWALNKVNRDGYVSNLPSVTDFPLSLSTHRAFTEPDSWTEGVARFYLILSQDFLYPDPFTNVIFLDNHDLTRYYTQIGRNMDIYKMALTFILTTRGIPQFYSGTEIVMEGDKKRGDGYLREDFPGGWPGDTKNAFSNTGLTETETEALNFSRKILNWRKDKTVIHSGRLKHYIPEDGLYVYFRYNDDESVMVILNNHPEESKTIRAERYRESIGNYTSGYDIIGETHIGDLKEFTIKPKTAMIIELK